MNQPLDQQHAEQNSGVDLPQQDTQLTPVEVDIDAGKAEEAAPGAQEPSADTPPPPKPPLPRAQQKIQVLTHERDEAWGVAERLKRELDEARAAAAAEKVAREAAERSGMENYGARVKAEMDAAKQALAAAKENKDPDAETEAQVRVAKAAAMENDYEAWAQTQPKQGQTQQQPQQPQPRQPAQQPQPEFQRLEGPVRDFISENPWFNAVQIGSDGRPLVDRNTGRQISNPDFDPEMHNVAMLEDQRIQREIRSGQLPADFMGKPEYFERVKTRVMTEFKDAFEPEDDAGDPTPPASRRTPQMGAPRQPVAPSQRQIPGQQRASQGTKMRLSGEQAELVRSLVDNGTMIYPRNHSDPNKAGKRMSYQDAYVQYAKNSKSEQQSQ